MKKWKVVSKAQTSPYLKKTQPVHATCWMWPQICMSPELVLLPPYHMLPCDVGIRCSKTLSVAPASAAVAALVCLGWASEWTQGNHGGISVRKRSNHWGSSVSGSLHNGECALRRSIGAQSVCHHLLVGVSCSVSHCMNTSEHRNLEKITFLHQRFNVFIWDRDLQET